MMLSPDRQNDFRILVMDDEEQYLNLYKEAFSNLSSMKGAAPVINSEAVTFDITYCNNSWDAVDKVINAIKRGTPYAVAFLDIRMPTPEDGIWVGEKIRLTDPDVQLVFVTGYSDYSPKEIITRVPPPHNLLYVQKPFSIYEILHFAFTLSCKWSHEKKISRIHDELETLVQKRTAALEKSNRQLEKEAIEREHAQKALSLEKQKLEEKVRERTYHLEEVNAALRVLLRQRDTDKKQLGDAILGNVKELVMPLLRQLDMTNTSKKQKELLSAIESNLDTILSPFLGKLNPQFLNLTPMEIQVANFVKNGLSNKEMADILGIAKGTVLVHRHHLREKLGLTNTKINLRTHLLSLD